MQYPRCLTLKNVCMFSMIVNIKFMVILVLLAYLLLMLWKLNQHNIHFVKMQYLRCLTMKNVCMFLMIGSELYGDSNIPSTSIIDVMETSTGVTTPPKMSNNSNISGPSNVDVIETSILDIQVPVTPKGMMNTTNKSMERK
ncbi:uncharacterized protein LOC100574194 isoform X1 [Acyrthosiphon pisum]|uniref:Uncharacterized protein n=1 Tax=Acyrthosiphon pisum TaxID=7029 RepID=A0A8R2BBC0_ACYPI|nr:uncharacterized protein LOC100574194 isoform X1 [Acyrthosiphon pisum]|eukprot:XP_008189533.1 PREDICTED: uncharacterized protein LOC100574194 isoform X1 [Acyrthosiphon pisum]